MKFSNFRFNTTLLLCIGAVMLSACGDNDLDNRFRNKLEQARSEQAEAANGESAEQSEQSEQSEQGAGTDENDVETPDVQVSDSGEEVTIDGMVYDKIFGDEFTGSSVDASKWNTAYQWGADLVINEEEQYYVNIQDDPDFGYDPFRFDGDSLIITADSTPTDLLENANSQSYLSGVLTSNAKFTTTYGYLEMRAMMPAGAGLWSGFWLLGAEFVDLKPQLFVAEHDGGRPESVFHNYNYHDTEGNLRSPGQWEVSGENLTTEFHTYGVQWDEQLLVFYVDGMPKYRIEGENVSRQDMYLILNLAVGGVWPGAPDGATVFPAELHIDYVRAYRKR